MKNRDKLLPHQQLVYDEANELSRRIEALEAYMTADETPYFDLSRAEKERMTAQLHIMYAYNHVLYERLYNDFK